MADFVNGTPPVRHKYYYNPKTIDLSVLRKEATIQSADTRFAKAPPVVIIHWHGADDDCGNKQHERYEKGELVEWNT